MATRFGVRCFMRTARRSFHSSGSTFSRTKLTNKGDTSCSRSVSSMKPIRSQAFRRLLWEPKVRVPMQVARVGNAGLSQLLLLECLLNVDGKDRYTAT